MPDPTALVWNTARAGTVWVCDTEESLELWPEHGRAQARRLKLQSPQTIQTVSQNGRWAAEIHPARRSIAVWDFDSGVVITNLPARNPGRVWFSPDSQWLLASIESGYMTWRTDNWHPGVSWDAKLDSGDPGEISFCGDSHLVAARHERETFKLLTFPDCHELVTLKPPMVLPVRSACLSADGTRLWLSANGCRIFQWDLAELRRELTAIALGW